MVVEKHQVHQEAESKLGGTEETQDTSSERLEVVTLPINIMLVTRRQISNFWNTCCGMSARVMGEISPKFPASVTTTNDANV